MTKKTIFFDIGANWGDDSLEICKNNLDMVVYAFEPTPKMAHFLREQSIPFNDRYHVIESAVENFNGYSDFYVQNHPRGGCNSLNEFNNEVIQKHYVPKGKYLNNELYDYEKIKVNVTRLETWIDNNILNLTNIDYFHCDTQGSDLNVLKSLGKYLKFIKEGKVECSKDDIKLYRQSVGITEMSNFLEKNNFEIIKVDWVDFPYCTEYNIEFKNKY